MKNILLLSNIYPNNDPEYKGTKVCHSFTKEWSAMGYNVRVVHFDSLFPRFYYWIGDIFKEFIRAKTGDVAYTNTPRNSKRYIVDNIQVIFVPLKKIVPHKAPSQKQIIKAFQYIVRELEKDEFVPDIVTAHFAMPQLQFLPLFKEYFKNIKTCLVLHSESNVLSYYYSKDYKQLMQSVDVWGFRSLAFQNDFQQHFGNKKPMFLCHSGIPDKYIEKIDKCFADGVKRFAFVGSLYKLKNVDITLRALHKVLNNKEYVFDIVGSGAENDNLHKLVEELGIEDKVVFHGQLDRDEAQNIVRNSDCFVMVSSHEAFGLVYVEAMAKGCITIGTIGQGIDGIIKNGENGFLCKASDVDSLADVINQIVSLSQEKLKAISNKAVSTAAELTDRKVAEYYINSIINI